MLEMLVPLTKISDVSLNIPPFFLSADTRSRILRASPSTSPIPQLLSTVRHSSETLSRYPKSSKLQAVLHGQAQ